MTKKVVCVVRDAEPDLQLLGSVDVPRLAVHRPFAGEPPEQPADVHAVVMAWCDAPPTTDHLDRWFAGARVDAYLVDEHVQIDAGIDHVVGQETPGVGRIVFARRAPALSRAEMAHHWTEVHTPIVRRHHPAFWHYVQNVVVEPVTADAPDVDGISEMRFRSVDDLKQRFYDSEDGQRIVAEDVAQFLDRGAGWRILTTERWVRV